MNILNESFTHYGSSQFIPEFFEKISNISWLNKASGGLWASPDSTPETWKEWCIKNRYQTEKTKKSFRFQVKPKANVLCIQSWNDLNNLPKHFFIPENKKKRQSLALNPLFSCADAKMLAALQKIEQEKQQYYEQINYKETPPLNYEKIAKEYDALLILCSMDFRLCSYFKNWNVDTLLIMNPKIIIPAR